MPDSDAASIPDPSEVVPLTQEQWLGVLAAAYEKAAPLVKAVATRDAPSMANALGIKTVPVNPPTP